MLVLKLQAESKELRMNFIKLEDTNKCLEENVKELGEKLEHLKACEDIRHKTVEDLNRSIVGITKCHRAVDKLIVFIEDAATNKLLDPALLFPSCDGKFRSSNLPAPMISLISFSFIFRLA